MSSHLPTRTELASADFYMLHLAGCENLVELREPRSTTWLDLPARTLPRTTKVNPKTCSAEEYAENFVYPLLLPALHRTLDLKEKLPTRTVFDPVDWLSVDLYRSNARHPERAQLQVKDIPYVKPCLQRRKLTPLPLSLFMGRTDAAMIIQAYCRGHLARQEPLAVEFRRWRLMRRGERRFAVKILAFLGWSVRMRKNPDRAPKFYTINWRIVFARWSSLAYFVRQM